MADEYYRCPECGLLNRTDFLCTGEQSAEGTSKHPIARAQQIDADEVLTIFGSEEDPAAARKAAADYFGQDDFTGGNGTEDLTQLRKDELVALAEDRGVEIDTHDTKAEIIAALENAQAQ